MASDWSSPPTPEELKADPWGAPPTAQEMTPAAPIGKAEAALAGLSQGASMGFGDEVAAGWRSLFGKNYTQERDKIRAADKAAREQHPYIFGGTEAVGSAIPAVGMAAATGGTSLAPTLAKAALPLAAGQGALQGAGSSNAQTPGELARDTAIGGGVGTLGYGVGSALGGAGRALVRSLRGRGVQAVATAAEKAAGEVSQGIKTGTGSLGGEVQKGQRIVENLRRLGPDLTPEQKALVDQLEQRLTASTLESLPSQAGTIAARDAELAALKSGASDALHARTEQLLSTDELKQQAIARLRRYGPVAAGTALGALIGGPIGTGIGALAGAGTRPMIRSLRNLAKNPAAVKAATDALTSDAVTTPGELLRQILARGTPAVATQQLVTQ